jgi:hypothetical protein
MHHVSGVTGRFCQCDDASHDSDRVLPGEDPVGVG